MKRVIQVENKFESGNSNYYQNRLYELNLEKQQLSDELQKFENFNISEQTPNQKKKSQTTIINPLNHQKVKAKIQEAIDNIYDLSLSAQKTIQEQEDDLHDFNLIRDDWQEFKTNYENMENELEKIKKKIKYYNF